MNARAFFSTVLMLFCLVLTAGCHRNRTKTAPEISVPVTTTAAPELAPAAEPEPATPEADATEPDPLAGELGALNEYLRRQGLLVDIHFDYDQSRLASEAREQLARSAHFLEERPELMVTIEGHCDERGTNEYNLALGERRARSAKDYLVSLGVSASRLSTISYGEERPVCSEPEESCWWQNRRAHPVVTARNQQ